MEHQPHHLLPKLCFSKNIYTFCECSSVNVLPLHLLWMFCLYHPFPAINYYKYFFFKPHMHVNNSSKLSIIIWLLLIIIIIHDGLLDHAGCVWNVYNYYNAFLPINFVHSSSGDVQVELATSQLFRSVYFDTEFVSSHATYTLVLPLFQRFLHAESPI